MNIQNKLWGGRFIQQSNVLFNKFNDSLHVDYQLVQQDIFGSIAWSKSLLECNVLTKQEQRIIEIALYILNKDVLNNKKKILNSQAEDIHSWVEYKLIEMVGPLGKKLHTGRSRNDQVTTDLKLWCKDIIDDLLLHIKNLQNTLLIQAEKLYDVIMPGYTHLQHAQPITFGYWCLAYLQMFNRDRHRLLDVLKRLDISPLGSGSLSGTFCHINRDKLAHNMNFTTSTENSLDAVSDRDYIVELICVASISMMHLSRLSEDLIFFNSSECNFIELYDSITSGSSLMPQKKNPDLLELVRGKSGRMYGYLLNILVVLKGLPLSYNKDMQEDKDIIFSSMEIWIRCLNIMVLILNNIKINKSICLISAKKGYSNATEIANYLVNKGMVFREAHAISGKLVLEAINRSCYLEDLDISVYKKYNLLFEEDIYIKLSLYSCINSKNVKGGVAFKQILKSIDNLKQELHKY